MELTRNHLYKGDLCHVQYTTKLFRWKCSPGRSRLLCLACSALAEGSRSRLTDILPFLLGFFFMFFRFVSQSVAAYTYFFRQKCCWVCTEAEKREKHLFLSSHCIWQEVCQHGVWKKISEHSQLSLSHRNGFVVYWTWHKSPLLKWFFDNSIIPRGTGLCLFYWLKYWIFKVQHTASVWEVLVYN